MRIISGRAKGKSLYTLKGSRIRPTSDRVKESIFDILDGHWAGTEVLDLFAGTGSLGLEAVSRGAQRAVFVEKSRAAVHVLRKNISHCGFDTNAVVFAMPVNRALSLLGQRGESFHTIFLDPPYGRGWVERTISRIVDREVLSRDGILVVEHAIHESAGEKYMGLLHILRKERYGETMVTFLTLGN